MVRGEEEGVEASVLSPELGRSPLGIGGSRERERYREREGGWFGMGFGNLVVGLVG